MEQLAQIGETVGTLILVGAVLGIIYAFYRILKYMLDGIKQNDD
jgi:TM2 domain-containing membrane protein YozV